MLQFAGALVSRTLASCKPGGSNYKIFASRMRLTGKRNCRGWRCAAAGGRWRGRTGWSWSSGWRSRSAGRPLLRSPPRRYLEAFAFQRGKAMEGAGGPLPVWQLNQKLSVHAFMPAVHVQK